MTQQERIARALKLIVPLQAAVALRCPKGMSPAQADTVLMQVNRAVGALRAAESYYQLAGYKGAKP